MRSRSLGTTLLAIAMAACAPAPAPPAPSAAAAAWREFEGTWSAAGTRHALAFDSRRVAVSEFTGTLSLAGPGRPAVGFRAEAVVFSDPATGLVGRAVWTDERGDRAFSELKGEGTAAGNRVVGTFVGGTGRYAGAEGTYEFGWRFVLENEEGRVQGQSVGLKGRVRVGAR